MTASGARSALIARPVIPPALVLVGPGGTQTTSAATSDATATAPATGEEVRGPKSIGT